MPKSEQMDDLITDLCVQAMDDDCEVLVVWVDGSGGAGNTIGGCGGLLDEVLTQGRRALESLTDIANRMAAKEGR